MKKADNAKLKHGRFSYISSFLFLSKGAERHVDISHHVHPTTSYSTRLDEIFSKRYSTNRQGISSLHQSIN